MNEDKYERTIDELEVHACKWWPKEVRDEALEVSVLQILLDTQERFISIMKLADKHNTSSLFDLIDAANFSYSLFLKHLVVLADFGSEPLQRINKDAKELFPNKTLSFDLGKGVIEYKFASLPIKGVLNNKRMKIDSVENLSIGTPNKSLCKDIIMMLLYGASSTNARTRAVLFKCRFSEFLGDDAKIEEFVRQNYIRVSRIISGKTAFK